jgi:predicted dehydrogenase
VAASAKLAVFVLPPAARSIDGAKELARLFAEVNRPLVVARSWQFEPAYMRLGDLSSLAGHVFAANAQMACPMDEPLGWRGDARRAGGGVLLHEGYEAIDAVVTLLGVPTEVYAATGFLVPPGQTRPYDTEDAATVLCRYADDRTATVSCRRGSAVRSWSLTLWGSKATVEVTPRSMRATDRSGNQVAESMVRTTNRFAPAVNVFATSLAAEVSRMPSEVTEHLGTMASIAAAYLSSRTGQPESPAKFLELPGVGER